MKFTNEEMQDLKETDVDEIIEGESEIINLKDNHLPKGLTPLEDLFDFNDSKETLDGTSKSRH